MSSTPTPATSAMVIDEHAMLESEREAIAKGRSRAPGEPWIGLALSGGGIRSATFCLGALQRLARADILKHFDYQSSVSGGGYTAASVQWWWTRVPGTDTGANFPYGTELAASSETENSRLAYIRWHANYLAPGGGISIWSAIAVLLRTLLISLFVWAPIAIGAMYAIEGLFLLPVKLGCPETLDQVEGLHYALCAASRWHIRMASIDVVMPMFATIALAGMLVMAVLSVVAVALLAVISIFIPPETTDNRAERVRRAGWCSLVGAIWMGIGGYMLAAIGDKYNLWPLYRLDPLSATVVVVAFVAIVLGLFGLVLAALQLFRFLEFGVNYGFRRIFDRWATGGFAVFLGFAVFASLPIAAGLLSASVREHSGKGVAVFGVVTAATGVISGLYGHFVQAQRIAPKYASRWAATLAGGAFLYLMILSAYLMAHFLLLDHGGPLGLDDGYLLRLQRQFELILFATLFFSLVFGWTSNLNYLGLHRFYRDRLMEAFLPSSDKPSNRNQAAEAPDYTEAERFPIADVWRAGSTGPERPYPLFNTNAILINDRNAKVALRGGESFLLSPLFLGSSATGWVRTTEHGAEHSPLTLATAMAASGAAANANAAYIGSGVTRDRLISIVMMLLNVRLGIWLAAPAVKSGNPNYFSPGFTYGVLSRYRARSAFLELSDGGHFDNLGIYELVRRRCDAIVVLDTEEDPSTSMSALASVCQRVLEDFNAVIAIGDKADAIAPAGDMGYPTGAKFTQRSFFVCRIEYGTRAVPGCAACAAGAVPCAEHAPKTGYFVYIKSNMIKGLSFPARGYKAKNPDFPNQSTVDQFFEPAQFEAYRELGYSSVDDFITALALDHADRAGLGAAVARSA